MAQALHLMNSPEIEARLASPQGRVIKLAASAMTASEIADELCLAALGRLPNSEERKIADQLFEKASRQEAAGDFLWTLLNSRDFLFNH